jgi:hypothetical protein
MSRLPLPGLVRRSTLLRSLSLVVLGAIVLAVLSQEASAYQSEIWLTPFTGAQPAPPANGIPTS